MKKLISFAIELLLMLGLFFPPSSAQAATGTTYYVNNTTRTSVMIMDLARFLNRSARSKGEQAWRSPGILCGCWPVPTLRR